MENELRQSLGHLWESVSPEQGAKALAVGAWMLLAAALGLYIRWLFKRCSHSASDSEAISRVFPLLAVITTGVIGIVKTSLALSLGFVGALALIRFRSAIKEPEELVYLFLCVAVGLMLGAESPLLAVVLVAVASLLALILRLQGRRAASQSLLLTIAGDADLGFSDTDSGVFSAVNEVLGPHTLQRLDIENGRGQVRLILHPADRRQAAEMVTQLKRRLPECELSYVNLDSTL